jgi:hypothetical protein
MVPGGTGLDAQHRIQIMRKIVLSDHTTDQAYAAANKRQTKFERAYISYEGQHLPRSPQPVGTGARRFDSLLSLSQR